MIRLSPRVWSELYGKDLIAFGTGDSARRLVPYLAQDPNIRLHGVTNSRVTTDDDGTFLETGLPVRSLRAWAKYLPDATILITPWLDLENIVSCCKEAGFHEFRYVTAEMVSALDKLEEQLAESQAPRIFEYICLANELRDAHKAAFSEFRGCNQGKTVAVVGTGPSLSYYTPIEGVSHIGVNTSFLKEDLTLDYYFITHYIPEWCEKLKDYNFIKFFSVNRKSNSKDQFPEYIIEENDGRRCFSMSHIPSTQIHTNIECYPLMGFGSIIFRAIHFALYTRPKKLLLIGCDCTSTGHFDGAPDGNGPLIDINISRWMEGYRQVKAFASFHYPDLEIISVNPLGLKGMFRDMYTEKYIDAHLGLDRSKHDIIQ